MKNACIHIYYGNGKGKTSASVGLAYRCAGRGNKVVFTAFLKDFNSGEIFDMPFTVLKKYPVSGFWFNLDEETKKRVSVEAYQNLCEAFDFAEKECCDLLVLDEVLNAVTVGCIDEKVLLDKLKSKPKNLEVVLTGRAASAEILSLADYASEIKAVKHPFDRGLAARSGIEM